MRLMSGIDTAMPDVRSKWSYHAAWNQNTVYWEQDFRQIASCGFDLLRWGKPWSMLEPEAGVYRWDLLDPKIELATQLGLEIFYPIVHFNFPKWLARKNEKHAVLSEQLADRLAEFTHRLLERYHFRLVIPVVEVAMEAFQRGLLGNWQPHLKGRSHYREIHRNVVKAFKASAKVAHEHGATVFCSEPAPDIRTVKELRDSIDIAGIDLYPHMHNRHSIIGYLRQWHKASGKPLCLSEFGTPESYNPVTKEDAHRKFVAAGVADHRVLQAQLLRRALEQAHSEGIPIPYGGWYPGTGNIGWGQALTKDRSKHDCDRAGIVDLARQSDGSLKRVLCHDLVREIIGLRNIYAPKPVQLNLPELDGFAPFDRHYSSALSI